MYVDRSRLFTRLLVVFCFCVWGIVVFEINAFASRYDQVFTLDQIRNADVSSYLSRGEHSGFAKESSKAELKLP